MTLILNQVGNIITPKRNLLRDLGHRLVSVIRRDLRTQGAANESFKCTQDNFFSYFFIYLTTFAN